MHDVLIFCGGVLSATAVFGLAIVAVAAAHFDHGAERARVAYNAELARKRRPY